MSKRVELWRADEGRVKLLLDHLIKAHEEFCEAHPEIGPMDDFMAVHNFHVVLVLSMERDFRLNPQQQLFVRQMALDTFQIAMENKPAFSQGERWFLAFDRSRTFVLDST